MKNVYTHLEEDTIKGAMMLFITPSEDYDVIGPFVEQDNLLIAYQLIEEALKALDYPKMSFFFKQDSAYYLNLMNRLNASLNEYEYHLLLKQEDFNHSNRFLNIEKAATKDKSLVKEMHENIFKDIYLTTEMLLEPSRYDHLYLYEDKGYALLLPKEDTGYLEVFGLVESARGKNLQRLFYLQ